MEIKKKTNSDQRGGEEGNRERRGRVKSRNTYNGLMDKDNGGKD